MKRNDVLLIIVVVIVSSLFSILISKALFSSQKQRNMTAEVVDPITPDFQKPDKKYFNEQSINPTQLIQIGDTNNSQPL